MVEWAKRIGGERRRHSAHDDATELSAGGRTPPSNDGPAMTGGGASWRVAEYLHGLDGKSQSEVELPLTALVIHAATAATANGSAATPITDEA